MAGRTAKAKQKFLQVDNHFKKDVKGYSAAPRRGRKARVK